MTGSRALALPFAASILVTLSIDLFLLLAFVQAAAYW
jgi:hypothetical protein